MRAGGPVFLCACLETPGQKPRSEKRDNWSVFYARWWSRFFVRVPGNCPGQEFILNLFRGNMGLFLPAIETRKPKPGSHRRAAVPSLADCGNDWLQPFLTACGYRLRGCRACKMVAKPYKNPKYMHCDFVAFAAIAPGTQEQKSAYYGDLL